MQKYFDSLCKTCCGRGNMYRNVLYQTKTGKYISNHVTVCPDCEGSTYERESV